MVGEFYCSSIDKIKIFGIIKYICAYGANKVTRGNTMNRLFIVLFLFYGENLARQRDNVLIWYCEKQQNSLKHCCRCQRCKGAELEEEVC